MHTMISGTGGFLPHEPVSNDQLPGELCTTDNWIVSRTGIQTRHLARELSALDMAEHAARSALRSARVDTKDIDIIIAATISGDMVFPSLAALLQNRISARHIGAFDVAAACSGFIYALSVANAMLLSGQARHVLVVAAEKMSRLITPDDRSTFVLFGDGAGAVVVSRSERAGILSTAIYSNGGTADVLNCAPALGSPYIRMQGPLVFRMAVRAMTQAVTETLSRHMLHPDDVHWFVPHQANLRIIECVSDAVGIPMQRVILTVQQHANVSAASIPLALDSAVRDGRIRRGDKVLLAAVGGGLTWGAVLIDW